MTMPKKGDPAAELVRLEDALIDSILDASETDLREEIIAGGTDPNSVIRRVEVLLSSVHSAWKLARVRIAKSKRQGRALTSGTTPAERSQARARLDAVRRRDSELSSKLLLAARNGQGASERDLDSLASDLSELEQLEKSSGDSR